MVACAYAKIFRRPRVVWRARAVDTRARGTAFCSYQSAAMPGRAVDTRARGTADEAVCVRARTMATVQDREPRRRLPPHDRGGKLQNSAQRARYSPVFVKESKLDFSPERKAAVEIRRQKWRRTMFRKNNNIARIESAFSRQTKKR